MQAQIVHVNGIVKKISVPANNGVFKNTYVVANNPTTHNGIK